MLVICCRQSLFFLPESESHPVVSNSLRPHGLYNPWNSPGQNTAVGSLPLLQWIFPTQESNQGFLNCRRFLLIPVAAAAKLLQWYLTLCDPTDTRLPRPWGSPGKNTGVGCHFLLQCMKVKSEIEVTQWCPTLRTPWTAAYQAPPYMGFSRQEHWSGMPLTSLLLISTRLQIHKVNARPAFYSCFKVWKFFYLITFPYFKISHKLKC